MFSPVSRNWFSEQLIYDSLLLIGNTTVQKIWLANVMFALSILLISLVPATAGQPAAVNAGISLCEHHNTRQRMTDWAF